jgi:hypothetical protein
VKINIRSSYNCKAPVTRIFPDPSHQRRPLAANKPKAGVNTPYARAVRSAEIERVAADDADEVLTPAAPLQATYAIPVLFKLGDRFAKTDPARGLRFTEEAVVRARALDPTERADYLAQAGDLVIRLGRKPPARSCSKRLLSWPRNSAPMNAPVITVRGSLPMSPSTTCRAPALCSNP